MRSANPSLTLILLIVTPWMWFAPIPGSAQQPARSRGPAPALSKPAGTRAPVRPAGTYVTLRTDFGDIVIRMLPDVAPKTVAHFVALAEGTKPFRDFKTGEDVRRPFYDGLNFHRVIPQFMIQGGDPRGDGTGGPGYTIPDETLPTGAKPKPYVRGAVLLSNQGQPNTGGSQFMILLGDVRDHLPKSYVVFGEVVEGMDVADRIAAGQTKANPARPREKSTPMRPVVIRRAIVKSPGR